MVFPKRGVEVRFPFERFSSPSLPPSKNAVLLAVVLPSHSFISSKRVVESPSEALSFSPSFSIFVFFLMALDYWKVYDF